MIGADPAGEVLAGRLSERGAKRVAIVERDLVGAAALSDHGGGALLAGLRR